MARASKARSEHIQESRSSRQVAIERVIDRATDVIGDRDEALRWIGTPVEALDYATPISLLATSKGQDRVLATLDQLEHGVL
jgi:putative toxin-antitoxin system antitoxin component (TIGR02293 family)